ncbi:MAG: iron-sulfur cluster-binding protein [Gemmatimonadetes bacterium]|nr:iron-sulfur cluster-binding protein [Gemmatimonadota bacterium]
MDVRSSEYVKRAQQTIEDTPDVRRAVAGATTAFDAARERAYGEIDSESWRRWAEAVKSHVLTHLDAYLEQAEARLQEGGVTVHWASSGEDVRRIVVDLAKARGVRSVVKGKSMLSEEVELNPALEAEGVRVFETDLGEYVLQLLNDPPSHILGPAIHRSLDDVRRLFSAELGTSPDAEPDDLAAAARRELRSRFLGADMGITGGNFLVAETGTLALIENEGNIRLTTSLPRIHVALVGIEKLLPTFDDLAGFLQLTARAGTGQPIGCFVSLIQGPARDPNDDGPEEVHVVLVDNERTSVLADDHAWEALRCLRCGACLNTCPVYKQTGGHAYGWVYSGPIGSVLDPGLLGLEQTTPLPFASSLCGACYEVCPVRIPIPELLLYWRREAQDRGLTPVTERLAIKAFTHAATHPGLYRGMGKLGTRVAASPIGRKLPLLSGWTDRREAPVPSPRRFSDFWREGIE